MTSSSQTGSLEKAVQFEFAAADALPEAEQREAPEWAYDEPDDGDCPNCGGEGFYSDCFEEWACIDPEGGCDLCMRRCDWCNERKTAKAEPPVQQALSRRNGGDSRLCSELNDPPLDGAKGG